MSLDHEIGNVEDGVVVLRLFGELDMNSVTRLKRAVFGFLDESTEAVRVFRVDMTDLANLDSSGIALLANLQKKIRDIGAEFVLSHPGRRIRGILEAGFLDDLFVIEQ